MKRPFAMPLPMITFCQSGWVSKSGWSGSEPMAVGYATMFATPSEYARATSGNHSSQQVGRPKRAPSSPSNPLNP